MSDIDDVSDTDSGSTVRDLYQNPPPPLEGPYLEIVEQPQSRGFRFRYACEGKSHGGLQGVNSRREKKSFPAVRINRYRGPARINVSLVTDGKDPKPHAHELIGKNCQNGTCSVVIKGENMTVSFPNLGVRHVTKKSVTKILTERIRESLKVDRMIESGILGQDAEHIRLTQEEEELARTEAEHQAKMMPLTVVRLKFQTYLQDTKGAFSHVLPAVISNPIYDSKAPCASVLKICRMDKVGGCCTGNEEVFLLCDKVQKDDITVRFYEQDEDGNMKWEDFGNFAPHDVHRQVVFTEDTSRNYAIVFRTPCYMETNIDRPVAVHVQLKRFSDGEVSDPKTFTYYPQQTDLEDIQKKRKKIIPHFGDSDFINSLGGGPKNYCSQNSTGGGGGGGVGGGGNGGIGNGYSVVKNAQHFEKVESGQRNPTGPSFDTWSFQIPVQSRLEADACGYTIASAGHLVSRGLPSSAREAPFGDLEPSVSPSKSMQTKTSELPSQLPSTVSAEGAKTEDRPPAEKKQTEQDKEIDSRLATLVRLMKTKSIQVANSLRLYSSSGDVRFLINPGRDLAVVPNEDGDNCLHLSIIHQQTEAAKNLLSVLSMMNDSSVLNDQNDLQQSPLYLAVATKQIHLLNMLLAYGADYTSRDKLGNTFLHLAARSGYELCLEQFLNNWDCSAQPSVNDLNFEGFSALHLAVLGGHLGCAKLLLSVGKADVNFPDARSGRTALHHAVDADNLAIIGHLILESGADVNQAAYDGNTPLHMAVSTNRLGVSALLMAADADPDAENLSYEEEEDDEDEDDADDEDAEDGGNVSDSEKKDVLENTTEATFVGQTPKDLAARNPKMLRILNGEPYCSVSEKMLESSGALLRGAAAAAEVEENSSDIPNKFKSVCDSGISSINILSQQRSGFAEQGDLQSVDSMTRTMLAKLLDPVKTGSDWRELAIRLGLGPVVRALQLQGSPTKALLDNYEVMNGTSAALTKCLKEMGRQDAVLVMEDSAALKNAD